MINNYNHVIIIKQLIQVILYDPEFESAVERGKMRRSAKLSAGAKLRAEGTIDTIDGFIGFANGIERRS